MIGDFRLMIEGQKNFPITGSTKIHVGANLLANRVIKIASKLAPTIK